MRHSGLANFCNSALTLAVALSVGQPATAQSVGESREAQRAAPPAVVKQPPVLTVAPALPPAPSTAPRKSTVAISLSPDGQTVYVVGMILEGSFHRFDEVLRSAPKVRTVYLSSAGGFTIEGRLMAALVRKRKLDTYVEFYCASACTQVFASGRQRTIGPAAQLGFHQAILLNEHGSPTTSRPRTDRKLTSTTVFGVNGNDTLRLGYEIAGIDGGFIDKALSYSNENMWVPTPDELLAARVITRRAEAAELPPPLGSGGTRDELRARLLQGALWRSALAKRPDLTETAFDTVWRNAQIGLTFDEAVQTGRVVLVSGVNRRLGRAPDSLLERSLALYGSSARSQRDRGYPACHSEIGIVPERTEQDITFERQEDQLLADVLMTERSQDPMTSTEASRIFGRDVLPKLTTTYAFNLRLGQEGKCRLGFQTFEAIDTLPPKQRIKAYRALLSLPGLADGE